MEQFIRHLIYDVLAKKTIDKVLKLIRKLDWNDKQVVRTLHNCFTKVWKVKYSHISLLAMLVYDLQRYHPDFAVNVVDQVLENIRRGLETNVYNTNQQRVATVKYLAELYIYRMLSSGIIFDTLWSLVTFGHRECIILPIFHVLKITQRRVGRYLDNHLLLTCRMISSESDLSA
jgi:regulator of nonsense transcripts 2